MLFAIIRIRGNFYIFSHFKISCFSKEYFKLFQKNPPLLLNGEHRLLKGNLKRKNLQKNLFLVLLLLMYLRRVKGAFSGLRQVLASESLLKMMKNVFYFT